MKKTVLPALMALTAIAVTCLLLASKFTPKTIASRFDPDEHLSPEDTVHPGPALFDDKVSTTAFVVGATTRYKNLTVYLIKGETTTDKRTYVTLQDAMNKRMVVVKETSDVNELAIDNLSSSYIYINSGDIVKGGKQDRTIQYDVIIGPNERNVGLASFCVEHGRWTQRGNENDKAFASSNNSLSSKDLKLAAKQRKSQTEVWSKVEEYQSKTNKEMKKGRADSAVFDVRANYSMSSLELTLNNKQIDSLRHDYKQHLSIVLTSATNASGLAYAINGKLYSIDLFNNQKLFADMANKLLDAAITEAISEADSKRDELPPIYVQEIFKAPGKVYEDTDINRHTRFQSSEPNGFPKLIVFTSFDKGINDWLHRNWIDKSKD